jgi:hypothetical protein
VNEIPGPAVYLPPPSRKPNARVRLRLPYGDRAWRSWLKFHCGEQTRPDFERAATVWTVARPHFRAVMHALARQYGAVPVTTEHDTTEHCTLACQNAQKVPVEECQCVCGGQHHGRDGSADWANVVGDLLVSRSVYRRDFICVHEAGTYTYLDPRLSAVGAPT